MPDQSWGVRLERIGPAVMVSPSGELRGRSVDRLREIVRSREPGLELLVLDLRDLVDLGDDGIAFLVEECAARGAETSYELAIVAGPPCRRRLEADPRCAGLVLHDAPEDLLAPYRERRGARR
ncbi:MAG TPA: hypothetical protein VFR97_13530 [Capillimicrobium sp.]|nr:hypothetical protein [Capillimicrobium sp.]